MREYLFRGKNLDTEDWVYGYHVRINHHVVTVDEIIAPIARRLYRGEYDPEQSFVVDSATIGQYTGLNDRHGTKIFEGDIVEVDEHDTMVNGCYQVIYSEENHCYGLQRNTDHHHNYFSFSELNGFNKTSKVIGNIYDNPELLTAGESKVRTFTTGIKTLNESESLYGLVCAITSILEVFCDGKACEVFRPTNIANPCEPVCVIQIECTEEQYSNFKEYVNRRYPGYCMFDLMKILK